MKYLSPLLFLVLAGGVAQAQHYSAADTDLINKLNTLSFDLRNKNPDSCRLLAQKAIALSEKINYAKGLGDGYIRLGIILKNEAKFDSAILLYKKSLHYRKLTGRQRDVGSISNNIGFAFSRIGQPDSALYYELQSVRILEAINDSAELIKTLNNIGSVYQGQKNYENAETSYQRTIKIAASLRDSGIMYLAMGNLGGMYLDLRKYFEAEPLLRQATQFSVKKNDQKNLATCFNNLARLYEKNLNPDSAIFYYKKSAAIDSTLGSKRDLAVALGNIGAALMQKEKYSESIAYLKRSTQISVETGDKELSSTNYKNLAQSYSKIGDYASAYNAQQQYQLFNDWVFNNDKAKIISEMQTKYEAEKKQAQINFLSTSNNLLSSQNKVQRLQKNISLAGVIILLVAAFGLFIFFRQKQQISKRNDQIQKQQIGELLSTQEIKSLNAMMDGQEKERKRIAADLHDRIGASLAAIKLHFSGFAKSINVPEQSQNQFTKVTSMFDDVVKEVRQVSHDLASGVLMKFGVVSAMRDLSDSIQSSGKMKVTFYPHGLDERLDHRTEISIYRITQELISNILKHAQASEINIHLSRHNGTISLMVEDDGVGFDPKKASGGIGMRNMRSRVMQMQGTIFFDSAPGKGCTVTVELPINSKS